MRSRMDKYYNDEEVMQRTSRNDILYDELYKEKQTLNSNVTVLDNINEIDITKIKAMVEKREDYNKVRDYSNLLEKRKPKEEEIKYDFEEIDSSNYDINELLKKKRTDTESENKIRKLSSSDYEMMSNLEKNTIDMTNHEKQLRDLFDTVANAKINTDLFSNLKEDEEETKEEQSFYTNTSKFDKDDFNEEEKSNNSLLIGIVISVVIIAIITVVYLKFLK